LHIFLRLLLLLILPNIFLRLLLLLILPNIVLRLRLLFSDSLLLLHSTHKCIADSEPSL
jgi:hypothetical protein